MGVDKSPVSRVVSDVQMRLSKFHSGSLAGLVKLQKSRESGRVFIVLVAFRM